MNEVVVGIIGLAVVLILFLTGIELAFAMIVIGFLGLIFYLAQKDPQRIPGRLAAACDLDAERVRAFCGRHGIPASYTDYPAMVAAEKPSTANAYSRQFISLSALTPQSL